MTKQEIINKYLSKGAYEVEQLIIDVRNDSIDEAAEKADIEEYLSNPYDPNSVSFCVNKQSILDLKIKEGE